MIKCTFENGHTYPLRHVTVGALVGKNREILLIRRSSSIHNGGKFAIPGGFLDRDETLEQAVLRELEEETGLKGKVKSFFHINDDPKRPKEDRQNVDTTFVVEIISGSEKLNKEVSEIKWFNRDNLPSDSEFAFDHRNIIIRYFEFLKKPFEIPILGPV